MGEALMYSALLIAFIVPMVQLVLGIRHAIMKKKWINEAVQKGHVVVADFKAFNDNDPVRNDSDSWKHDSSEYSYTVDGKSYKYKLRYGQKENITLYYRDNPKYAQVEKELGCSLRDVLIASVKVWLVIFILMCLIFCNLE